jgi:hypothetical protein
VDNLGFIIERRVVRVNSGSPTDWQQIAGFQTNPALRGQGSTSQRTEYEFLDSRVQQGAFYEYRLANVDVSGMVEYSKSIQVAVGQVTETDIQISSTPHTFELQPAFPNPFNPETTISYSLPKTGEVSLKVYDLGGREVATLAQGQRSAGQYQLTWNAATIPSGVYLVVLRAGGEMQVQKVAVLK